MAKKEAMEPFPPPAAVFLLCFAGRDDEDAAFAGAVFRRFNEVPENDAEDDAEDDEEDWKEKCGEFPGLADGDVPDTAGSVRVCCWDRPGRSKNNG